MSKIWVSVSYPIQVEIDFDTARIMDDDYIEEKREEAKRLSAQYIVVNESSEPVINDAEIQGLVE